MLALQGATEAGTSFVFGYLGGAPLPFEERPPGVSFVLAFRALPMIIVISALTSLLMYWRILPIVVRGISALLEKLLGIGGAAALAAAANVFVGMIEAPLFIHPYLSRLSRSELFIVMCSGYGHHRRYGHDLLCHVFGSGGPRGDWAPVHGFAYQRPRRHRHCLPHGAGTGDPFIRGLDA